MFQKSQFWKLYFKKWPLNCHCNNKVSTGRNYRAYRCFDTEQQTKLQVSVFSRKQLHDAFHKLHCRDKHSIIVPKNRYYFDADIRRKANWILREVTVPMFGYSRIFGHSHAHQIYSEFKY